MGDRTFSAEDVIRIFQDFLTRGEQRTVEEFFREEPEEEEEPEPEFTLAELRAIVGLIRQLFIPLRPILTFVLNRFSFFIVAASTIQFVLDRLEIILDDLFDRGVIDA